MIMYTVTLLSEQAVSLKAFIAKATLAIRGAEVNVISDERVEVLRGDDYVWINEGRELLDSFEEQGELRSHGIDPERAHELLLACPTVELLREVVGVLAEQIKKGWLVDDNGEVTPFDVYRKRLATAQGFEDL